MVSVQAIFGDVLLDERLKGLRWSLCANAETGFELDVLLMGADLDALHSLCEFAYEQGLWGLVDRGGVHFRLVLSECVVAKLGAEVER